jgi:integrase
MKVKNKNLPDFKVPLSDEVVNILKNQYQYTSHQEYVFLSVNNKVLNSNTTNVALQRMRYKNKQISLEEYKVQAAEFGKRRAKYQQELDKLLISENSYNILIITYDRNKNSISVSKNFASCDD